MEEVGHWIILMIPIAVLSINPSANLFLIRAFNVHHKDWLTYSDGTGRPGELCYNFSTSTDLTHG